ncbi:MAG: isopentenyl-diphosphate Delta-isomerase [Treponema sp.]|nr:isopentenyl-diphosphate Delta-isomerase [Treponema sp.]
MENEVVLVNIFDQAIGTLPKLEAHKQGKLHRAFSIFIYDGDRLLIQRRAAGKYHSAGLWANSCCSHPRPDEELNDAAKRRLLEEAGISCALKEVSSFIYRAEFDNGLTEYELDHIFVGEYGGKFIRNEEEADDMCFVDMKQLSTNVLEHPEKYAAWFITAYPIFLHAIKR